MEMLVHTMLLYISDYYYVWSFKLSLLDTLIERASSISKRANGMQIKYEIGVSQFICDMI